VTREELADVRRFLEESEMRRKMSAPEDKPPDVPPRSTMKSPYELVKQCSAGDVPTVGSQGSAFRPFRPTHFLTKQFDEPPPQFREIGDSQKAPPKVASKPTPVEIKNPKSDAESEEESGTEGEDDDTDYVEEKAVMGKAFKSSNDSSNVNSTEYDPSSALFTPSQSVQIAVHKAAINKQLSVEEERRQGKELESETSDEDTMTDASYESETEKAESDGYEEEDKEFEEDEDHEQRNVRTAKAAPPQAGIVRNMTYTIQPNVIPQKPALQKQNSVPSKGQADRRTQEHSKQTYVNEDKKKGMTEPEMHMMHNKAWVSAKESQAARHEEKTANHQLQQRNPPPYVHHDANHQRIDTLKSNHPVDQRNGKSAKSTPKEPIKKPKHEVSSSYIEDNGKLLQDRNNNRTSSVEVSSYKNSEAELRSSAPNSEPQTALDSPKAARFANRQLKKQKMKRANTIDIPKPLHYYDVEDSEASSDGESLTETVVPTTTEKPKVDNKPVHKTTFNTQQSAERPRQQPADERRGSIPQKLENKVKQMFEENCDRPSYNPQAHGGAQWNSRFANIKTCFENPSPKEIVNSNKKQSDGLNRARSFWRSADDSSLKVSKNSAFHDPKLTKQGSQFLKKLHEQKDQGQALQKLPWTATEHENVVVGSLVVPANLSKNMQSAQPHGPVNKFSHAPMSAFRPIEKKSPAPAGHTPWAAPSVTGSVKQIASSKFSQPDAAPPTFKQEPPKHTVKASVNLQAPSKAPGPISPTLPWTKDVSHGHNLNSTLAKFESMSSRESSPQLMPNALLRSHSQDRVPLSSNFTVFNKNVPVPPPRTYIPSAQTNVVLTRTQNLNASQRQELPFIPEQHPHPLMHSKSNQYLPHYYSGPIKGNPLLERDDHTSDSEQDEPAPSSSRLVLSTLQSNLDHHPFRSDKSAAPVQTYSAGVTARQSIYGVVPQIPVQQTFYPEPERLPAENTQQRTFFDAEPHHLDFAEEHTAAVTRVMGRPQCQAAVTVSHKTRHYNQDDEGERGSAAFHLASLLHKFSGDDDGTSPSAAKPKEVHLMSNEVHQRPKELQQKPKEIQPKPKEVQQKPKDVPQMPKQPVIRNSPENWTSMSLASQTSSLPPKPEGSPRLARAADSGYNRKVEQRCYPLPVYSEPDRTRAAPRSFDRSPQMMSSAADELPDFVYASRFEIPVNKVQNITMKFQSLKEPQSELIEERKPPVSPNPGIVLRKSESWHQLAAQQQGLSRRPQSMVASDLPPVKPRSPNPIHKAKSSHSLAFPKQFEAAIKPEALEKKQKTVEEFFKKGKSEAKTQGSSIRRQTKISHSMKSYSTESTGVMLLDDNMDNVDEAFESLFNATSNDGKTKLSNSSRLDNKASTTRMTHR